MLAPKDWVQVDTVDVHRVSGRLGLSALVIGELLICESYLQVNQQFMSGKSL